MEKQKDSFIFYRSFYEAIKELPKENQLNIYNAIIELSLNKKELELSGIEKTIFTLIKPNILNAIKNYENGCFGGRPNKPKNNPIKTQSKPKNNPIETNEDEDVDKYEDKDKDNRYGELKNVRLSEAQYNSLKEKYHNLDLAIEKLDTWLGTSGSKHKNKNHFAYFKSNSWAWEDLDKKEYHVSKWGDF